MKSNSERQRRHRKAGARQISTPISDEAAKALAAIQVRDGLTIRVAIERALIYTASANSALTPALAQPQQTARLLDPQ